MFVYIQDWPNISGGPKQNFINLVLIFLQILTS